MSCLSIHIKGVSITIGLLIMVALTTVFVNVTRSFLVGALDLHLVLVSADSGGCHVVLPCDRLPDDVTR